MKGKGNFKRLRNELEKRIQNAIEQGDVFRVNEIQSNMFLGNVLLIITAITVACLFLNEIGVFTADILIMRFAVAVALLIQTPIILLNQKYHGEASWMKFVLEFGLLIVCAVLGSTLGHNVTLIMVFPVILSIRYCDIYFTRLVATFSVLFFFAATLGSAYYGIINLNMYKISPGTVITVTENLRQSVVDLGIDKEAYLKSLLINDYLPRLLIFVVIALCCVKIAEHCRNLTKLQDEITSKASRIETELNLATEIQAGMLPCIFPAFPDHGELELFASNTPAKEVGGDFYDYFKIDDDHVAVVMADVSGKGVGAALFMTISKIVIKNQLLASKSPAAALTEANRQLCENNEAGLFVTTWAGVYDISSGTLTYTNAGHNPPIVYRKGSQCEYIKGINGMVLACMDGIEYTESTVNLSKGDEIFLYTDGITEATDRKKELYGEDRLINCLNSHIGNSVKDQILAIIDDINRFVDGEEQFDDVTMLGMKIQ